MQGVWWLEFGGPALYEYTSVESARTSTFVVHRDALQHSCLPWTPYDIRILLNICPRPGSGSGGELGDTARLSHRVPPQKSLNKCKRN